MIGQITIHLHIPKCTSLKEKRSRIRPLLARLHRQFNVSAAELDLQDKWEHAIIACAMVANNGAHIQSALETICHWVEANWTDGNVVDTRIEII